MIEVKMPQLGESVPEGTVTQWHIKEGDYVKREQTLLEVATDKADSEVPSPSDGVIVSLHAAEGDILPTGGLLCRIDESAAAPAGAAAASKPAHGPSKQATQTSLSSPSTRKMARERGVDLGQIAGTGERGRVTREDIARAATPSLVAAPSVAAPHSEQTMESLKSPPPVRRAAPQASGALDSTTVPVAGVGYRSYKVPTYIERSGDKLVPFSRRRRITADHMIYSQAVSPHVVTVAEIDLYGVATLRDQHKRAFKAEGVPLTYLSFVIAAVVSALREFPSLNARVLDDSYVLIKDINVGIAVNTPNGLLVANVKNTDRLSLRGIAASVHDVASRARDGKVTADDLMGTTFTVSNPGRKGNLYGGAIISQPNVAILRIGEIKKRPVVITQNGDDHIAIHPMMYAALSYDHRIVDGVEANSFLWHISDILNRADIQVA